MSSKSVIFYTDNTIKEPVKSVVEELIVKSGLPIVSTSLKPLPFGRNIIVSGERGYMTYIKQIVTALEFSDSTYVFFCEHDVLYPREHFEFTPPRDDIFYYNSHVFRWMYGSDTAVTYDRMLPLSVLCVNREFALKHYKLRLLKILEHKDEFNSHEPALARKWGYEPGTKKRKRGGLTDDDFETFTSKYPVIDIRHSGTFSPPKCTLDSFKHAPVNWSEIPISEIPGWNLKELLNE
jgi:hypothetical protein